MLQVIQTKVSNPYNRIGAQETVTGDKEASEQVIQTLWMAANPLVIVSKPLAVVLIVSIHIDIEIQEEKTVNRSWFEKCAKQKISLTWKNNLGREWQ